MGELAGGGGPLVVRMYVAWRGVASEAEVLALIEQVAEIPAPVDLVVSYRDLAGDARRY